ncbi:MAG: hemolysin [Bacteroidetes bacterium GWF2_38_335]|nr:MAG: hemolysin [Bacteroidetes bacterium GWF2_38_335]OFY78709.1 MAG: hemolysin [Bacteroidetes bacterium RIFOXYA12_FULL_38_20]HBS88469.1 hemolysin [Bacteroidales bacterium]
MTNIKPVFADILYHPFTVDIALMLLVLIVLLFFSAMISGSEVAFFSMTPQRKQKLIDNNTPKSKLVIKLINNPEKLLATILIANNTVNVGIVILSSYITSSLVDFSDEQLMGFIFQVIVVTFLILLFGEIIPKVYATRYPEIFTGIMAYPVNFLNKLFSPLSFFLIRSTSLVNKRITKKSQISIDELSQALDITSQSKELKDDEKMLKGIVKFGRIDVKEIMKSRIDTIAVDINTGYKKLISIIVESGFSRIPVYEKSFDHVKGVLYIKDLLSHLDKEDNFDWGKLIRPPYFVPESKKIDDLLEEFQTKKIHLAIVIDEYGGTSGIITLEDILEEIVGEINDEFDVADTGYTFIQENEYLFEAKISLNDFNKVVHVENDFFDKVRGDADTLAGLILEIKGNIPQKNDVIIYKQFEFTVKAADIRRIKQVYVKIKQDQKNEKK